MRLIFTLLKLIAWLTGLSILVFAVGVLWPLPSPAVKDRLGQILLTNVAVVNVENGIVDRGQRILVEGDRILAMGPDLSVEGAQVIDAGGRHAIPGLFDMHVHSFKMSPTLTHPLFVAAGVTAVRDMGGCIGVDDGWVACAAEKRHWNQAIQAGSLIGPRYDQITSLAIDGGSEIPNGVDPALGAATAEGARARVAHDKARGIDFLKPYSMIPREGYFALAKAARAEGMYVAGHQPLRVTALEAIAAGQRSIEHAFLFAWDCYPGMASLREVTDPRAVYTRETRQAMIERHDPVLCSTLHQAMVAAGTAYVPTHTTRKLDAFASDKRFRADPRLRQVPGPLQMLWRQDADNMIARAGADGTASYRAFYEFGIAQTGVAHRAGVTILAGTDAPDSFAFPGSGLHDELDHLVMAGLSPLAALQAATQAPARFLGLEGRAGVIRPGARADIVVLDGNPLQDIRVARKPHMVMLAGTPYDRTDLDALLAGVERAAGSWSMWPKFAWQLLRSPIMRKQFAD